MCFDGEIYDHMKMLINHHKSIHMKIINPD